MELGQRVKFTAVYQRHWKPSTDKVTHDGRKVWMVHEQPHQIPQPWEGVLVGLRTLSNGTIRWDYDSGTDYRVTETLPAALVAYDLRRTPVLVPMDHLHA